MTAPAHPATIGRFKIIGLASQGGMGAIYRAEDPDDGKPVAVKYLPEAFGRRPEFVERFKREARIYMSLSHPAIPKFYDFGTDHDRYYLAMEWVAGIDLQTWIVKQEQLPDDATWRRLFEEICRGVAYAHSRGVFHRDLSARNVMVMPGDRIQIMDFGLSKTVSEAHFTQTGDLLGTPEYTSPEQLTAAGKVTAAADIWSLGVLGYQMATRQSPFAAETNPGIIRRILDPAFAPPAPATINPALAVRFDGIIRRCLERDLDRRYARVEELLADLEGDPAQPIVIRPRRRRRSLASAAPAAGLALLLAAGLAAYRYLPVGSGSAEHSAAPVPMSPLAGATPLAALPFEQLFGQDDTDSTQYFFVLREIEYPNLPRDEFLETIQAPPNQLWKGVIRLKDAAGHITGIVITDGRDLIDHKLQCGLPVVMTRTRIHNLDSGVPFYVVEMSDRDRPRLLDPKLRFRGRLARIVRLKDGQFEIIAPESEARAITTLAELTN